MFPYICSSNTVKSHDSNQVQGCSTYYAYDDVSIAMEASINSDQEMMAFQKNLNIIYNLSMLLSVSSYRLLVDSSVELQCKLSYSIPLV
jgi:hypothetical protein